MGSNKIRYHEIDAIFINSDNLNETVNLVPTTYSDNSAMVIVVRVTIMPIDLADSQGNNGKLITQNLRPRINMYLHLDAFMIINNVWVNKSADKFIDAYGNTAKNINLNTRWFFTINRILPGLSD